MSLGVNGGSGTEWPRAGWKLIAEDNFNVTDGAGGYYFNLLPYVSNLEGCTEVLFEIEHGAVSATNLHTGYAATFAAFIAIGDITRTFNKIVLGPDVSISKNSSGTIPSGKYYAPLHIMERTTDDVFSIAVIFPDASSGTAAPKLSPEVLDEAFGIGIGVTSITNNRTYTSDSKITAQGTARLYAR